MLRRVQIQTDDIGRFLLKLRRDFDLFLAAAKIEIAAVDSERRISGVKDFINTKKAAIRAV